MSMLTGLKVSSLAFKCAIHRPENNAKEEADLMELNFEGLEMQKGKWKNGVRCLVAMLTLWVMIIKMSKMAHFCMFC